MLQSSQLVRSKSDLVQAQVGKHFRVLDYTVAKTAHGGKLLPLTVYWMTERRVFKEYAAFAQLIDLKGERVAQDDTKLGVDMPPTSVWKPGEIVPVHHNLELPPSVKPGLTLVTGMYRNRRFRTSPGHDIRR